MKITLMKPVLFIFLISYGFILYSQEMGGGEYQFNTSNTPCLTAIQRENIIEKLKESQENLKAQNKLIHSNNRALSPLFIWPVIKSANVTYHEIWTISNYVDHNLAYPNQVTDYNGGSRSYDTPTGNHRGIDISTWPYGRKMQDEDGHKVIAASDGQIIYKHDGEFDKNCSFNPDNWNAVYIQHGDGSVAWYGHLKSGSLTSKSIGSFVTQGEYLGIVGSSGNSTGPHLHFEIYEDNSYSLNKLIDPYAGAFNTWNTTSWWENQKPYLNPTINALTTNNAAPNLGTCPEIEIPNESDHFNLNSIVYFTVFLKDQLGTSFDLVVYKPNNTEFVAWHRNLPEDYSASYYWYSKIVTEEGQWRVECTLSTGQVIIHNFTVGDLSNNQLDLNDLRIYPNPCQDVLTIELTKLDNYEVTIVNSLGQKLIESAINTDRSTIDLTALEDGVYFVTIDSKTERWTQKLVKKQ